MGSTNSNNTVPSFRPGLPRARLFAIWLHHMNVRNGIGSQLLVLLLGMPGFAWAGEPLSPLTKAIEACHHGSLSETGACLHNLYTKKNNDLEIRYKYLLSSLEEPALLKASQATWLKFRDQACEYETSGLDKVGSLYFYLSSKCLLETTDQRLSRIDGYLNCKDSSCPARTKK